MTGLDIFAAIVLVVLLVAVVIIWVVLAMLPGKIARNRNHPQAEAINVSGWLGALFMGVFWPLALIWAFTRPWTKGPATPADQSDDVAMLRTRVEVLEARLIPPEGRQPQ
jgi:hypothetical protein